MIIIVIIHRYHQQRHHKHHFIADSLLTNEEAKPINTLVLAVNEFSTVIIFIRPLHYLKR